MDNPNFIIYSNKIEIHNVTKIKEYNTLIVEIDINDVPYVITGQGLTLVSTENQNSSLFLSGDVVSIRRKGLKQKNESFFKRLFK